MYKELLFALFVLATIGCQTTEKTVNVDNYLNLTTEDKKDALKQYWTITKRVEPQYPIQAAIDRLSGCVELLFGINELGRVSGYQVKNSYPEGVFDQYAAASLTQWHWQSTPENTAKQPVLSTIKLQFMVENARNQDVAVKQCEYEHM
ncbi:energy transducer TonB [uncultured Shewanella sp.]|uniref:energy transducer TonB n=1 Tax=uncultured Shewanella sp. TaxID=173975 RepID=UPI0026320672|nr:energy transducer TonB [uncultured Shewanella sp.]